MSPPSPSPPSPPLHSTHTLRSIRQSTGLGVPNEGTNSCKTFITKRKYLRLDFSLMKRTACMKRNTYVKTTLASIEQLTNRWYSEIGSVSSSMIFFSSTGKNIRKKKARFKCFQGVVVRCLVTRGSWPGFIVTKQTSCLGS